MSKPPEFETFEAEQRAIGQGEMWLTHGGKTQHLRPGDRFELARELPHSERYGSDGAIYWVARTSR